MPLVARTLALKDNGGSNNNALVSDAFTPDAGEVICIICHTEAGTRLIANVAATAGSGITFTRRVQASDSTSNTGRTEIWTAKVAATPASPITVTVTASGSAGRRTMEGVCFSNADLAATPATNAVNASTTCSSTLTTTADNSAVVGGVADWNGVIAGKTYRSGATEIAALQVSAVCAYGFYQLAGAAGAQTYGMSAPAGQKAAMAAIEILDATPAGPSFTARTPRRGPNYRR